MILYMYSTVWTRCKKNVGIFMFFCFGNNWICFLSPLTGHLTQTAMKHAKSNIYNNFCKNVTPGTYFFMFLGWKMIILCTVTCYILKCIWEGQRDWLIAGFLISLLSQFSLFESLELWLSLVSRLRFRFLLVCFVMRATGAAVQTITHKHIRGNTMSDCPMVTRLLKRVWIKAVCIHLFG